MTDSFDSDLTRLMRFRNGASYPVVEFEFNLADRDYEGNAFLRVPDRVQMQFGEKRFGFLYRHHEWYHWCGYVVTLKAIWEAQQKNMMKLTPSPITFVGPSTEPLCWMIRNTNGKLRKPSEIFANDWLIGFDMRRNYSREDSMNIDIAIDLLMAFENTIHRITESDLNL